MRHGIGWLSSRPWVGLALASFLVILTVGPLRAEEILTGRARALAADVVILRGAKVRLIGIDPPVAGASCRDPDSGSDCAEAAKRVLNELLRGQTVSCRLERKVGHGSYLGACRRADGGDLAAQLLRSGWVRMTPGIDAAYAAAQAEARAAKRGLWAIGPPL